MWENNTKPARTSKNSARKSRWERLLPVGIGALLVPAIAIAAFDTTNWFVESQLGVGTDVPERSVHVRDENAVFRLDRDRGTSSFLLTRWDTGFGANWKTFVVGTNASGSNNGSFIINDLGTNLSGGGTRRFTIENDGRARFNKFSEILESGSTRAGFSVDTNSTILSNTEQGTGEEAFLAQSGDTAILTNPADSGGEGGSILQLRDQDDSSGDVEFHFTDTGRMEFALARAQSEIDTPNHGEDQVLKITGEGESLDFMCDDNDDTTNIRCFNWFDNGGNKLMDLEAFGGDLRIAGTVTESTSFDLAESFYKGQERIQAGHVVRVDPKRPDAVVLARDAEDTGVVGVASTSPGFVLGGAPFDTARMEKAWGKDMVKRFEAQEDEIFNKVLEETYVREVGDFASEISRKDGDAVLGKTLGERAKRFHSFEKFVAHERTGLKNSSASALKEGDQAELRQEYEAGLKRLTRVINELAIEEFFQRNFTQVALSGRVPVKVDASYGSIRPGDLLVASPTPGHAMSVAEPRRGAVVGKALESHDQGKGEIMMLVMLQ